MFITLFICFFKLAFAQDPVANIIQGRVVGIKVFMENSVKPTEIYFGIPYAAPPIGRLRFCPPERHLGWKKTFYAHRMAPSCPQLQTDSNDSSENCLFLNIWTSRRVDGQLQPVIVILYSEYWTGGSLNLPCQELASEGVVVVTVSYRLHLLSFFTLKSLKSRGNLALLDQYMALLWIRENISAFGGDPTSVTLLGHSAGADSVLHHIVSPRSVGLFHRAVIMSPRNIGPGIYDDTAFSTNDIVKISREMAQSLGCLNSTTGDEDILQCMQNKPLTEIMRKNSNTAWEKYMQPTSDDFLPESARYLPISLAKSLGSSSLSNMPLDIMIGTTDLNSLNLHDNRFKNLIKKSYKQIYDLSIETVIPELLQKLSLNKPDTLRMLIEAVKWEYWRHRLDEDNRNNIIAIEALAAMDSAVNWGLASYLLAEKISKFVSRLYVYRCSYPFKVDLYGNRLNFTGAVSGADLISLLGDAMMLQVARRPATSDEKRISTLFRHYILNFIKFGSPATHEEWPRFTFKEKEIKNIFEICCKESPTCTSKTVERDVSFWQQYLPKLANSTMRFKEYSDSIVGVGDESRLRGGIFAMCGISLILLLMLLISGLLLHRRRLYRPSSIAY